MLYFKVFWRNYVVVIGDYKLKFGKNLDSFVNYDRNGFIRSAPAARHCCSRRWACRASPWSWTSFKVLPRSAGIVIEHRNLRTRSGMHLCMQDNQNGQKRSADKTRLTHFILLKKILLVANGLVWQLMVTPLWTCLALQGLFVNSYWGILLLVLCYWTTSEPGFPDARGGSGLIFFGLGSGSIVCMQNRFLKLFYYLPKISVRSNAPVCATLTTTTASPTSTRRPPATASWSTWRPAGRTQQSTPKTSTPSMTWVRKLYVIGLVLLYRGDWNLWAGGGWGEGWGVRGIF
jgi:hypothetical protein